MRGIGTLNDALKSRLGELEKELKHIITLKEKYVKDHPEEKDKIFKPRGERRNNLDKQPTQDGEGTSSGQGDGWRDPGSGSKSGDPMGHLYDQRTGLYKDPKRSVYYDPTYNPFGAPPPGMPYREKSTSISTSTTPTREEDNGGGG